MKKRFLLLIIFLSFCKGGTAQVYHSLIITEIMADPTPSRGLPDKEYIELYNNSSKTIDLRGYELKYASSSVRLGTFIIEPEEYVILCRVNNIEFLRPYGKVLGLERFSLLNAGTTLNIFDPEGVMVFTVTYSDKWYTAGRDQGYSLEMIDIGAACKGADNWTSSSSDLGGTPGKTNASAAIVTDTQAPLYLNYSTDDNKRFIITFSENLVAGSDFITSKPVRSFSTYYIDNDLLVVELEKALESDESLILILSDLSDCIGNIVSEPVHVVISNTRFPIKGEIILSEILFNPKGSGSDFVEIMNVTDQTLNLGNLLLARVNNSGEIDSKRALTTYNLTIAPYQILCLTENKHNLLSAYPFAVDKNLVEMPSLPSYPNESGTVVLLNTEDELFEMFSYSKDYHHWSVDDPDGVSLERINPDGSANDPANWQSVSSVYSYATPGFRPSYAFESDFELIANPFVFSADGDGIEDFTEISVKSQTAGTLTLTLFDVNGAVVRKLATNEYVTNYSSYFWYGDDFSGIALPVGYYLAYAEFVGEGRVTQKVVKILLVK
jgi:hypothetical protein